MSLFICQSAYLLDQYNVVPGKRPVEKLAVLPTVGKALILSGARIRKHNDGRSPVIVIEISLYFRGRSYDACLAYIYTSPCLRSHKRRLDFCS